MVRVVARVEEVVVERAVEPVVEELHGAGVQQRDQHRAVRPPQRQVLPARQVHRPEVEEDRAQNDLVVPANSTTTALRRPPGTTGGGE